MNIRTLLMAGAFVLSGLTVAHADAVKFEMWHGLTGDLGDAVGEVCKRFNESQKDYEIVCTSQGSYDNALQNAIAFCKALS